MKLSELYLNFLFPKYCIGCRKIGSYFCLNCSSDIIHSIKPPICPVCTKPAVGGVVHPYCKTKYSLDGFIGVFHYERIIRKAVKAIKFRRQSAVIDALTNLTIETLKNNEYGYNTSLLEYVKKHNPVLIPIPLHSARKRKRWFNQSELIANNLAKTFSLTVNPGLLIRTKQTKPQAQLTRKDRFQNVKGVFTLFSDNRLPNTDILIIDDVWTTGATLREAASVFRRNGAKTVWGLTIAR
jgi:ComF family protein